MNLEVKLTKRQFIINILNYIIFRIKFRFYVKSFFVKLKYKIYKNFFNYQLNAFKDKIKIFFNKLLGETLYIIILKNKLIIFLSLLCIVIIIIYV
jgi:hypothetical protein